MIRSEKAWTFGLNANLPADIAVRWAKVVSEDFHARFSATARRYRYLIYNHPLAFRSFSPLSYSSSRCIGSSFNAPSRTVFIGGT